MTNREFHFHWFDRWERRHWILEGKRLWIWLTSEVHRLPIEATENVDWGQLNLKGTALTSIHILTNKIRS